MTTELARRQPAVASAVVEAPAEASSILMVIERASRSPDVDIDKMQRLLDMHTSIMERQAKTAYAAALARMQPELPIVAERGGIKDRNGNVQSRYALWEDIVGVITPVLAKHGFALSFRTKVDNASVIVTGVLSHEAGHSEETSLPLPFDQSGSKNAVQAVGSSVSYGKRYTAGALLNLRTGETDDDGRSAGSQYITPEQAADIEALIDEVGANRDGFLKYLRVPSVDQIPSASFRAAVAALEAKRTRA